MKPKDVKVEEGATEEQIVTAEGTDETPTEPQELNKDDYGSEEEYTAAVEKQKADNLEPWQMVDDEPGDVPTSTHVRMKDKLKGRISERDEEIERLRLENEALKNSQKATTPKVLKRPRKSEFEDEYGEVDQEKYDAALDQYEHDSTQVRYDRIELERKQKEAAARARQDLDKAVDSHYERADKLIQDSGIKPDIYKEADLRVRKTVDAVMPKQGDLVVNQLISLTGEGSEKVMYYLGNNKNALNEFMSLLTEDKSGMKAAIFLGQQKERLTNPKKLTTRAPAPSPNVDGDAQPTAQGAALKRKYDKAHKSKDAQAAYNAKKEARKAGIDTSKW